MSLKKILLVAAVAMFVGQLSATQCQAQNTFKRHRPLRWLGQGFSDGYHRCNPAYDSSYYNPYSAHNSTLLSQSPEYLAASSRYSAPNPTPRFFSGVPFSVYAAPPQLNTPFQNLPGQQVESSFSPSIESAEQEDDNSFVPDSLEDDSDPDDEPGAIRPADLDELDEDAEATEASSDDKAQASLSLLPRLSDIPSS